MIIPTAEPFFFPGNRTACLLVHGFTGAPKEMRGIGEYLNQSGYTVMGVRLAGHATTPEDMARMHWEDWVASVEDGYAMLRGISDSIFIIGLSMGGILSLLFAANHAVAGVVTMSVPFELPKDPRLPFARLLSPIIRWVKQGPPDWQDPSSGEGHVCYPYFSTKSVIELRDLLSEMRIALPKITAPVLLIHSRKDAGVLPQNAEKIYNALCCSDKQLLYVEKSGHVITREPDREIAFQAAGEFIQRLAASNRKA
jgi:carboxylesterase